MKPRNRTTTKRRSHLGRLFDSREDFCLGGQFGGQVVSYRTDVRPSVLPRCVLFQALPTSCQPCCHSFRPSSAPCSCSSTVLWWVVGSKKEPEIGPQEECLQRMTALSSHNNNSERISATNGGFKTHNFTR